MRRKKSKSNVNVTMACKGSIDLIRSNKEKGSKAMFYCPNYEGKVILVDNTKGYVEYFFDNIEQLEKYLKEVY